MNRFAKFAASALALSLVPAMLMGCGKKEAPTGSDLDYIKQKGTLSGVSTRSRPSVRSEK